MDKAELKNYIRMLEVRMEEVKVWKLALELYLMKAKSALSKAEDKEKGESK